VHFDSFGIAQRRLSFSVRRLIGHIARATIVSYAALTQCTWLSEQEACMSTEIEQNTYDQFADEYAHSYRQPRAEAFHFNLDLVIPRLLAVADPTDGLTVLDAGCGEGIVSRSLSATAAQVVGIDVAPRLIAYARERDLTKRITYVVHDLSQPLPEYAQAFDLIVSNLVLDDVPGYIGFITTLSQCLKPHSRLVLSMNNPYSAVLREKVESYFASGAVARYNFGPVSYYHRTMEDYSQAFGQAGLLLRRLYDVQMTEAMVAQLPTENRQFSWFSMYHRFPFVLILDLVKTT
jgi:2-polyprenyl-3-methyl-5-hydroxy-6-metoxy-1,4-benzoquinol methylase